MENRYEESGQNRDLSEGITLISWEEAENNALPGITDQMEANLQLFVRTAFQAVQNGNEEVFDFLFAGHECLSRSASVDIYLKLMALERKRDKLISSRAQLVQNERLMTRIRLELSGHILSLFQHGGDLTLNELNKQMKELFQWQMGLIHYEVKSQILRDGYVNNDGLFFEPLTAYPLKFRLEANAPLDETNIVICVEQENGVNLICRREGRETTYICENPDIAQSILSELEMRGEVLLPDFFDPTVNAYLVHEMKEETQFHVEPDELPSVYLSAVYDTFHETTDEQTFNLVKQGLDYILYYQEAGQKKEHRFDVRDLETYVLLMQWFNCLQEGKVLGKNLSELDNARFRGFHFLLKALPNIPADKLLNDVYFISDQQEWPLTLNLNWGSNLNRAVLVNNTLEYRLYYHDKDYQLRYKTLNNEQGQDLFGELSNQLEPIELNAIQSMDAETLKFLTYHFKWLLGEQGILSSEDLEEALFNHFKEGLRVILPLLNKNDRLNEKERKYRNDRENQFEYHESINQLSSDYSTHINDLITELSDLKRGFYQKWQSLKILRQNNAAEVLELTDEDLKRLSFIAAPIDIQDEAGDTLLHEAIRSGQTGMVEKLIRLGANPYVLNHEQMTAFDLVIEMDNPDVRQIAYNALKKAKLNLLPLEHFFSDERYQEVSTFVRKAIDILSDIHRHISHYLQAYDEQFGRGFSVIRTRYGSPDRKRELIEVYNTLNSAIAHGGFDLFLNETRNIIGRERRDLFKSSLFTGLSALLQSLDELLQSEKIAYRKMLGYLKESQEMGYNVSTLLLQSQIEELRLDKKLLQMEDANKKVMIDGLQQENELITQHYKGRLVGKKEEARELNQKVSHTENERDAIADEKEEERARADEEKARADEEKARADEEKARADRYDARLDDIVTDLKNEHREQINVLTTQMQVLMEKIERMEEDRNHADENREPPRSSGYFNS